MKASLLALTWLAFAAPALAAPPPGTNLQSAEHLWWECWHQPHPKFVGPYGPPSCCSEADGHNIADENLRQATDNWQIRIEGKWWDVPNDTIVAQAETAVCGQEPNAEHQTEAKAWYTVAWTTGNVLSMVNFLCFRLPTLY